VSEQLYNPDQVQSFFTALGKDFNEMAHSIQTDEEGFMLATTLAFESQIEDMGSMRTAFVIAGLICQFVEAHLEVKRLQAVLAGDPKQTEDPETHELWRQASVKYAEKADRLLLEVVKNEGNILPASLMLSIKELLKLDELHIEVKKNG
jgi:hypothetical protein